MLWYLLLCIFWLVLQKFNFWEEDWTLGSISTHIWDFSNISQFSKILWLKALGIWWGDSYNMFIVLDIKFHFTCGESDLY